MDDKRVGLVTDYERHAERSIYFSAGVPLPKEVMAMLHSKATGTLADLGCGDGNLVAEVAHLTKGRWRLIGVDVSQTRCQNTSELVPLATVICGDVCQTSIASGSIDVVTCNQVIEHLSPRAPLVVEMLRILKPGGLIYVSSVAKRPWAVYVYRRGRRFVIDPTHLHEYDS